VAPSSPNNGDTWTTATGIFVRINGGTVGPLGTVSSPTLSNPTFTGTVTFPDSATWSSSGLLSGTSLVVGSASALNLNGLTPKVQVAGTTNTAAAIGNSEWSNDGSVPTYSFYKSRGTAIGTLGITQSGDNLGIIKGITDDGSTAGGLNAAQIAFVNDAVPTAGNAYGRISFYTRNATTITEVARINDTGQLLLPGNASALATPIPLVVQGAANNYATQIIGSSTSGQSRGLLVSAGTNSSDQAIDINNQGNSLNLLIVTGAGAVTMPQLASSSAATTGTVCWTTGGNLTVDTSTTCLASLEELKNIHGQIDGRAALAETARLNPFWFSWKAGTPGYAGDKHEQLGLGAHATERVDPRLVGYGTDGKLRGVRYEELTALLVADIKEQEIEIVELRREVAGIRSGHGVPSAANDNFFSRIRYVMGW
jgi:hypothetical protein